MSKILSFAWLDLITIKPYNKSYILLIGLGIAMSFMFGSANTLCLYLMMSLLMVMAYPFTIGEKNGMDTLYATLSLNRTGIVLGRYVFAVGMELICMALVIVLSMGLSVFAGLEYSLTESLGYLSVASLVFAFVVGFQYPMYFRFGYSKAKWVSIAPVFIVSAAVIFIPKMSELSGGSGVPQRVQEAWAFITERPLLIYGAPLFTGLLVLGISCALACRLYKKREL